jgi:hypothetical protein
MNVKDLNECEVFLSDSGGGLLQSPRNVKKGVKVNLALNSFQNEIRLIKFRIKPLLI